MSVALAEIPLNYKMINCNDENTQCKIVINNDKIWFEILKEFMIENAKGFANTRDCLFFLV